MWAVAGSTGAVGLEIAIAIGIGYFGGRYLDGRLGTNPWLTWVGFGAGVGAAIKALVRVVRSYQRSLEEDERVDEKVDKEADEQHKKNPPP